MAAEAKSSKGVVMYLSMADAAMATVVPTAITKAIPTVVTAPAPSGDVTAYAVGQIVLFRDTGFPELDDKLFTIESVTPPGSFTVLGADTTNSTGVLAADPEVDVYDAADLLKLCLNNFAFNLETPGTIPAGTYCNPTATLPATATAVGTATLGGWIDVDDEAYAELLLAEDDGLERVFSIVLPQGQGEIIAPLTINGVTWDIPLEGGMAFTANANLAAKPRHLF
jgi:hypothetical protein